MGRYFQLYFLSNYSAGTAILINKTFKGTVSPTHISDDGRLVSLDIDYGGSQLRFVSVYTPKISLDRKFLFSRLSEHLSVSRNNIVLGDFNCVNSMKLDTLGYSESSSSLEGSKELGYSLSDFGLTDSFRYLTPRTKNITWFGHQATLASHLDQIFVSQKLLGGCSSEFFPYSDHKFVHCSLFNNSNSAKHGKSYWKLNNSILSDDYFKQKIENLLIDSRTLGPAFSYIGKW